MSRSGWLAERPNQNTVMDKLKKLFSGFERVTGTEISEELRKDASVDGILEVTSENTFQI
jgi:hypothetical protein